MCATASLPCKNAHFLHIGALKWNRDSTLNGNCAKAEYIRSRGQDINQLVIPQT